MHQKLINKQNNLARKKALAINLCNRVTRYY